MKDVAVRVIEVRAPDGIRLAGEVHCVETGPVVIFLHGGGQSRSAWRGAARRLADVGYRACTMDLRGHGDSDWSDAAAYHVDDFAGDLIVTIQQIGSPAILVGASLGGHVATLVAARRPDLCRALLLADVTPWIDEEAGDHIRETLRGSAAGFANVEGAAAMIARLHGISRQGADPQRLRRHLKAGEDGRLYWRWDTRFLADSNVRFGGEGGLFAREAAKLVVPVLAMIAQHSNLTTPGEVAAFKAAVPQLESTMIPGARHMVTGDVNDAYADAILRFLAPMKLRTGFSAHPC